MRVISLLLAEAEEKRKSNDRTFYQTSPKGISGGIV